MKHLAILFFAILTGLAIIPGTAAQRPGIETGKGPGLTMNPNFGKIPLYFIPNQGQVDERVLFYAKTSRYTLWVTKDGLVFDSVKKVEVKTGGEEGAAQSSPAGHSSQEEKIERDVSRLVFLQANKNPGIVPLETTGHQVNYYIGNDSAKWQKGISTSTAILYKDLYNNIDLKVYGNESRVEYDWIIRPGGNPADLRFEYKNVNGTRIDKKGNLRIETKFGELLHKKPVSWQVINGEKIHVEAGFKRMAKNTYGFDVHQFSKDDELIIDPVVSLDYSTYLGGSGADMGMGIAIDKAGCIYVSGRTDSLDFPVEKPYQNVMAGYLDVIAAKFNPGGSGLIYSTYLGGTSWEEGYSCAITSEGLLYIAGTTNSSNFPAVNTHGGANDAFVCLLDKDGNLTFSQFLGGSNHDYGFAVTVDGSDHAYVTGQTRSSDFPTLKAYQNALDGYSDAFISKIHYNTGLIYSTYLGGSDSDRGLGVGVDDSGSCYVTGDTYSKNFPVKHAYQNVFAGGNVDCFVSKLKPDGSDLMYSTYLGGSANEAGWGITVDASGSAYVAGDTFSMDFPTKNAYQDTLSGPRDAFITSFSPSGTQLNFSTYLGGKGYEVANDLEVDNSGRVYVSGFTNSSDFPVKNATPGGNGNVFVTKFQPGCSELIYSLYLGGAWADYSREMAIDSSGNAYVTGFTYSSNYPMKNAYQGVFAGGMYDIFVSKLSFPEPCKLVIQSSPNTGASVTVTPEDINGEGNGITNFSRLYNQGSDVTLTAPERFNNRIFNRWNVDGAVSFARTIQLIMNDSHTVTAIYQVPAPGRILTVQSKPAKGVPIAVSPQDLNGKGDGSTNFSRAYNPGEVVTLTAAESFKSKIFYQWEIDGVNHFNRSLRVTMDKDHAAAAVYENPPALYLSRTHLYFGACPGKAATGAQNFLIENSGGLPLHWTVSDNAPWLDCSPASGTNFGEIAVSVNAAGLAPGTYTGAVEVSDPHAENSPQTVNVTLRVYDIGDSKEPFGYFETPREGVTVMSSIPVTGWVLDDIEVMSVKIYRREGKDLVYLGDAVFVAGARPDVELAYPDYPKSYRAGWGYMMLTNFLPQGGNGTFILHAIATDKEGHQVTLGTRTLHCDNAHAVKPFGAIDMPAQGGIVFGPHYRNQGWVLTPRPNKIPEDGHSIKVWIDGTDVGTCKYNIYRSDIAALFPGYANSNGAMAYFDFNSAAYENGVHTIQWTAVDNAGNVDGLGSRYFTSQNTEESAGNTTQKAECKTAAFNINPSAVPRDYSRPIRVKKGYDQNIKSRERFPDQNGNIAIEIKELQRLEIDLGADSTWIGFQEVGNRLRRLPVGSFFDPLNGMFYWQPGPGYLGRYRLVFLEKRPNRELRKKIITVYILPKFAGKIPPLRQ